MPVMPAAPSVWPKQALTLPMTGRCSIEVVLWLLRAPPRPPTSMGSPRGVPVPCTATKARSWLLMPPALMASRIRVV